MGRTQDHHIKVYRPREELKPYVRYYYVLESDVPMRTLTFPIGCPQMIFHRKCPLYIPELESSQAVFTISGQVNFAAHVECIHPTEMIVAVFHPHTISLFIDTPPCAFYDQEISGFDIENKPLNELAYKIIEMKMATDAVIVLENWLMTKIRHSINIARMQASVTATFRNPSLSINQLAEISCLGKKQFERVFREHIGLNPKEFARIVRFQRALRMMQLGSQNYTDIAYVNGYSDQSHFIREFKQFSGLTPKALVEYQTPYSDLFTNPS